MDVLSESLVKKKSHRGRSGGRRRKTKNEFFESYRAERRGGADHGRIDNVNMNAIIRKIRELGIVSGNKVEIERRLANGKTEHLTGIITWQDRLGRYVFVNEVRISLRSVREIQKIA